MNLDKAKIIDLIECGQQKKAERLIKSLVTPNNISSAKNIEFYYSTLLSVGKHHDIFKYLKLNKVPPNPIDTSFDIGRRFLYTLHLTNQRGGHRVVEKYLSNIKLHRTLEYRFLGGIYFDLLNFSESSKFYEIAYKRILKEKYVSVFHDTIISNLLYALFYAGEMEKLFFYKSEVQSNYGEKFNPTIKNIDGIYHVINNDLKQLKENLKLNNISGSHRNVLNACACYMENDISGFEKYLIHYDSMKRDLINQQIENPRRYFSGLFYIKNILGASADDFISCINFKNFGFPLNAKKFGTYEIDQEFQFSSLGDHSAENYINLKTQEYYINGARGLGLSSEILAISSLVRAGSLGMSFEYLAGEVYDNIGYSEMFLIRGRIKQVIHRVKTHYNFNIKTKKYIAYIDNEVVSKFRIDYCDNLTMPGDITIENICRYYSVTENTAQKYFDNLINS